MFCTSDISRESLKYQRFTSSSCKDGRSSKIEFKTSNGINLILCFTEKQKTIWSPCFVLVANSCLFYFQIQFTR